MSFYAKACFIIAVVALAGIPFSYFAISKQEAASIPMQFEVLGTDTEYISTDRRTIGWVHLKGEHPTKGMLETRSQVGPHELEQFEVGSTIPGKFVETEKEHYAHIGHYADVSPWGPAPMFGGFAVVFGLIGFFLARKGGG